MSKALETEINFIKQVFKSIVKRKGGQMSLARERERRGTEFTF